MLKNSVIDSLNLMVFAGQQKMSSFLLILFHDFISNVMTIG
jgi:hypothetical protein